MFINAANHANERGASFAAKQRGVWGRGLTVDEPMAGLAEYRLLRLVCERASTNHHIHCWILKPSLAFLFGKMSFSRSIGSAKVTFPYVHLYLLYQPI